MEPTVFVLQGVPGSGKSYLAKSYVSQFAGVKVEVVSADDFFVELGGGTYKFDKTKLEDAHGYCFRRFIAAVQTKAASIVIVDNTNTTPVDVSPYMLGASAFGYKAEILRVECDVKTAAARNTHNVPFKKVEEMAARIKSFKGLPRWKLRILSKGD